jgi:hypothetical protein
LKGIIINEKVTGEKDDFESERKDVKLEDTEKEKCPPVNRRGEIGDRIWTSFGSFAPVVNRLRKKLQEEKRLGQKGSEEMVLGQIVDHQELYYWDSGNPLGWTKFKDVTIEQRLYDLGGGALVVVTEDNTLKADPEDFTPFRPQREEQRERLLNAKDTPANQSLCPDEPQLKLRIGQPENACEQEADRVADAVMNISEPKAEVSIQTKPLATQTIPMGQTLVEGKEGESVHVKPTVEQIPQMESGLEGKIHSLIGDGQPLPQSARSFFKYCFGQDFGRVRVHSDWEAAKTAEFLNARAYTLGQDVVFGAGEYAPESVMGNKLLAHELVHVIQQMGKKTRINRWSKSGVESELCSSRDRWVIDRLNSLTIFRFNKIERHYKVYHKTSTGGKGAFSGDFSVQPKGMADRDNRKIWVKAGLSDKYAASTFFHEVIHQDQPITMVDLEPEFDAWIQQGYFHMRHGMPEKIKGTRLESEGAFVADVRKIKEKVTHLYDFRNPASPFLYEHDRDEKDGVLPEPPGWSCPSASTVGPPSHARPPRAKIRPSLNPRLRSIRTSGAKKGYIYLTTERIASGTSITLLQENVKHIDYDGTTKDMTEILYRLRNYWIPHDQIEYPP